MSVATPPEGVAPITPRQRLAAALRPLIALTVASEIPDERLSEAAVAVEAIAGRLRSEGGSRRPWTGGNVTRSPQDYFSTSPVIGPENPIAPPLSVWVVEGPGGGYPEIRGEAWFDYPYEGPPTCVHGGVIAETFDEILGAANVAAGNPGMTGTLVVRFLKPTPLRTELRLEARCRGRDGRKISTWAGIYHGDVLTAEADGIFIEVAPARILAVAKANAAGVDSAALAALRAEAARLDAETGSGAPR